MKKLLNDGWSFLKLPYGSSLSDAEGSSAWISVDLPHDWLIWQQDDLYESADAWYRRELFIPDTTETCMLHFDGVYMDCDVVLNGEVVCSHAYGYTAFYADLSGKLVYGTNRILVHIRHRSPNSRWYSGSGIFRDVHLIELPADHLVPDSIYLKDTEKDNGWCLHVSAETAGKDRILFSCGITDAQGKELGKGSCCSENGTINLDILLKDAPVWDIESPEVCILRYTYGRESGMVRFGLRTTKFTPDHGFFLNHRQIKLKGVCLHHDLGALGAAFHPKAARRQLQLMKDMGANAVRTSHNPPASAFLDLCDELGILVIDEAFDMWERPKTTYDYARFFPEHEEEDVALWVRRDRLHPCVIMWSIGNEIYDMHADLRGTEVCAMLMNQVHRHDPEEHAKVTFGCNYMPWEGGQRCADVVKIAGYNYGEKYYAEHHLKHPEWVIYGSETASVLSSRNIYHFPIEKSIMSEADRQCSALGNSNTSWGAADLREMIVEDLKCSYSMGQFIWSGIDYIGEPTPYHTRSCYFGQADTACFPKDPYYLFKSLWTDQPVLHIGVTWDWNPGQLIDVPVMTNYRRVVLLLNGRSMGEKDVVQTDAEKCLPVWKIPYESGEIRVLALDKDGKTIAEDFRRTPGDTSELRMIPEDCNLKSDGHDLAFVTIQAYDREGNPVDNARDRVKIVISGGAYLAGTDNGDSTDSDGYKSCCRRLFGGKLLLILASNGERSDAEIYVESTSGIKSHLTIPVLERRLIPGISSGLRLADIADHEVDETVHLRKIEIVPAGDKILTPVHPECSFTWKLLPQNAQSRPVMWQVTNSAGIETPFAELDVDGNTVRVKGKGDGDYYLRALGGNAAGFPEIISQIEFYVRGMGCPSMNPYQFISAGLYDLHEGDIGTGNEKGIAFSRDGVSMAGFSSVDFGKSGSDTLTLPIFALDGKKYDIELIDGDPRKGGQVVSVLEYQKPSIWNRYQEETYRLPVRLTGIHTICFRMKEKVHMKGFIFEKQERAFISHAAGEADSVAGDAYRMEGGTVAGIGNNVSLHFDGMDFGNNHKCSLTIRGQTPLSMNSITVRMRNEAGETENEAVDFIGNGGREQVFTVRVPGGKCSVTFVFLPGSCFDFESFRFLPAES